MDSERPVAGDLLFEVESGDERRALEAIRRALALALAEAEPREAASVAKQLQAVIRMLADMGGKEIDSVDQLRALRERGRADSAAHSRATGTDGV